MVWTCPAVAGVVVRSRDERTLAVRLPVLPRFNVHIDPRTGTRNLSLTHSCTEPDESHAEQASSRLATLVRFVLKDVERTLKQARECFTQQENSNPFVAQLLLVRLCLQHWSAKGGSAGGGEGTVSSFTPKPHSSTETEIHWTFRNTKFTGRLEVDPSLGSGQLGSGFTLSWCQVNELSHSGHCILNSIADESFFCVEDEGWFFTSESDGAGHRAGKTTHLLFASDANVFKLGHFSALKLLDPDYGSLVGKHVAPSGQLLGTGERVDVSDEHQDGWVAALESKVVSWIERELPNTKVDLTLVQTHAHLPGSKRLVFSSAPSLVGQVLVSGKEALGAFLHMPDSREPDSWPEIRVQFFPSEELS